MAGFGLVRWSPGLAGLLAAQTISPLGDAMARTALILYVQRTMGSATAVGLLLYAQAIPPLAAPFAGVVADRFAPGRLLSAGWLTQAVLAGLLALSLPPLGALLAAVFVLALIDTPLSAAVGRCIRPWWPMTISSRPTPCELLCPGIEVVRLHGLSHRVQNRAHPVGLADRFRRPAGVASDPESARPLGVRGRGEVRGQDPGGLLGVFAAAEVLDLAAMVRRGSPPRLTSRHRW